MLNKNSLKPVLKLFLIAAVLGIFAIGVFYLLKTTGLTKKFSNVEELKLLILSSGFWCYAVFSVLQFLQVTILPIPSFITTIAGVIIFGPFAAFLLSTLSIILGSIVAYSLGKIFGIKLLYWSIGKQKTQYFQQKLEKGKFVFFVMMLFPLFPDDILCMLAGVINLNFKFFLITNLITRPLGLFCVCFLSSGYIIPYSSWGLLVWGIIAIILITSFIIFIKNKTKLENFVTTKILKNK